MRDSWETELRGALSLDCRNIDHLGYGLHYDIVLNPRQTIPGELPGAVRPLVRKGGGQRGD